MTANGHSPESAASAGNGKSPAPAGPALVRYIHSYALPRHWARRDREIEQLCEAVEKNEHRILSLIAIGGAGKSALTRKLLDELPERNVRLDGALWFSFYFEPEFDRFLAEACLYVIPDFDAKRHPSPYEKVVLLLEALQNRHFLLVLDGLEVLLVSDRSRKDFGAFQDGALREFIEGLCEGGTSQLLISSRFPILEREGSADQRVWQIADLGRPAADELMVQVGVGGTEEEREQIYERFGCHALTLQTLASYLARYFGGDPSAINSIPVFPSDSPQGIKVQAVLEGYWKCLEPAERFFLTRMSAFRGGVDDRSLIVLNKSGDSFDPEFRTLVQRLQHSPLVSVERRDGFTRFTSHPLIKTYFYERMAEEERSETHRALKDYAQGLPIPDRPRTLQDYTPLLEACHHALQVGLYPEAYQMYRRNNMDNALRWWGHYAQAQELLEPLRKAAQAEKLVWQTEPWQESWVENETALIALLRGDTATALVRFEHSAELDAKAGDGLGESASYQNIAGVLLQRGEFRSALQVLKKSRAIEMMQGRYEKEDMLAGLEGICYAGQGKLRTAFDQLSRAANISAQRPNNRALCYWTWRIGDLYLVTNQLELAGQHFAEALKIAMQEQFRDYEGHALRGLGDTLRGEGDVIMARQRYTEALRLARTLGNPYLENEIRLSMARLALQDRHFREAEGQSEQALRCAMGSGYAVQATEAVLVLAQTSIRIADMERAKVLLEQAHQLIEQTGHAACRQELERIDRSL